MEYKAIIFDLDGTLLDTLEDLKNAVNYALEKNSLPIHSSEFIRNAVGNGIRNLVIKALDGHIDSFDCVFEDFKKYYALHKNDYTKPYKGISELINFLKAQNFLLAVVSNKSDAEVKALVNTFFPGIFAEILGEVEGTPRKPHPEMIKKIIANLGFKKEQCLYVGDSEVDIQTAINSGLNCLSVTWGFRTKEQLTNAGSIHFAHTPDDIKTFISEKSIV